MQSVTTKKYWQKNLEANSQYRNIVDRQTDFIDNNNIKKDHLGEKNLNLNKKNNSVSENNFLKYLRSNYWKNSNSSRTDNAERVSKLPKANAEDDIFKSLKISKLKTWITLLQHILTLALWEINFTFLP